MADHGFSAAGYDKDAAKVTALRQESKDRPVRGAADVKEFIGLLRRPRAVMMLVPAGPPVDSVIKDLLPHLDKGDLIIDAGNSYFKDTDLRAHKLAAKGIQFLGVGVSGGEEGARRGPSIMPGGPREGYELIRPIFEAAAAKVGGDPCLSLIHIFREVDASIHQHLHSARPAGFPRSPGRVDPDVNALHQLFRHKHVVIRQKNHRQTTLASTNKLLSLIHI